MDPLKPLFTATSGAQITLDCRANDNVITYVTILERIGGAGGNQAQWNSDALETGGARSMVADGVDGYNVIIFPELSEGGSIDARLTVGGVESPVATLTDNNSAGWRIFVF